MSTNASHSSKRSKSCTQLLAKPSNDNQRLLALNADSPTVACFFEVHGRVQCVAFRKYTKRQANALWVRGWCANTVNGTVRGELQGPLVQVTLMQNWLRWQGSPRSKVQRVVFGELRPISEFGFRKFEVR